LDFEVLGLDFWDREGLVSSFAVVPGSPRGAAKLEPEKKSHENGFLSETVTQINFHFPLPDKKALMNKDTFCKQKNVFWKNFLSEGENKRIFVSHDNCSFLYNVSG